MNAPAFKTSHIEISSRLYNGEVLLQRGNFGRKKHAYYLPETNYFVPGVTSILGILDKPALLGWAAKMAAKYMLANFEAGQTREQVAALAEKAGTEYNRVKEEAGDIGTQVHVFAESYFRGLPVALPENPLALKGVNALLEWVKANDVRPIEVERMCFSRDAFFAGTMDLLASVNGKLTYVDLKTGKGIYKEHLLQSGAYKYAWEEENREAIEQIVILNCNKLTGVPKIKELSDAAEMQFYTDTFLRVKSASDNLKKIEDFIT